MNLRESADYLATTHEASDGVQYTMKRRNDSVTVTAVEARKPSRQSDGAGRSALIWVERDLLVRAAVLILAGDVVLPQVGDRWEKVTASDGVFEVCPLGGEPHYRNSDPYGIRWRIHLKRVAEPSS